MQKLHTIIVSALLASALGCAADSARDGSPAFTTTPETAEPRLAFQWSDQITSWNYLSSEPKEFANPSHVGPTDELVVVTAEGEVVKYQAANGATLWRNRLGGVFHAGATIGLNHAYVADLEGRLRALNLSDGEIVWEHQLEHTVETRGTYSQGRLFIADAADRLHAYDAETGDLLWTYSREIPEYFTVKGTCAPVVDVDVVYCGFSDGTLAALQIDSGDLVWESDLSGGKANFTDVDGPVMLAGDRIYAVSYAGGVFALDRQTGTQIWRTETESAADFTRRGDRLYVASAIGRVTAIDLVDGEPLWGFKMSKSFPGSVIAFGPYLVVFATDGPVYVLDGETGYPHMKWIADSGFLAPVEFGSSRMYALNNGGRVFALKLGY